MNSQQVETQQPIFFKILKQSFEHHKIPHAFLLVGKNATQHAHFIAKSLICENSILACDQCHDCHRIDDHNYGDLIYFNGMEESIKKDSISYIRNQFSKSALEGKAKVYILDNIENSTIDAMNSLLKILEEPEDGVYAIFTCQNLARVLPTIQSRCQIIQLLPESKSAFKDELMSRSLPQDDVMILSEIYDNIQDCEELIDSEYFNDLKNEVYHFIEDLYFKRENLMIDVQTHLLKKYKDKASIDLFLNMLVLSLKDLFHVKQSLPLIYASYKDLYERIEDSPEQIINKINLVLETIYLLNTNANVLLLMDSMMINI